MKAFYFILFFIISFYGCQKKQQKTTITVSLEKKTGDILFRKTIKRFKSLDTIPDYFQNIPKLDSFAALKLNLNRTSAKQDLERNNHKNAVFAISGFKKNKQIVILDVNNNYNFGDDPVITTSTSFKHQVSQNPIYRDSITQSKVPIEKMDKNGAIYTEYYFMKTYPYYGSYYPIRDSIKENYKLVAEIDEYWYGEFTHNETHYKIAIDNSSLFGQEILLTEQTNEFDKLGESHYYPYTNKDTIELNGNYFKIGKINRDKVDITKVNTKRANGYRTGDLMEEVTFTDINTNQKMSISELLKEKEFVLFDFWGTWCSPCKEMTPDLIALNKKYKNKLNIVSFAYDKEVAPVKSYINEHHMDWYHAFIEGNAKGRKHPKIINNLRIEAYPTLILIDSHKKIVLRGHSQPMRAIDSILAK